MSYLYILLYVLDYALKHKKYIFIDKRFVCTIEINFRNLNWLFFLHAYH